MHPYSICTALAYIFHEATSGKCPLSAVGYGHDEIASYALCFGISKSGKFQGTKHCDTKMPMVCIYVYTRVRVPLYICTAWASVLLFFPKGNTRASKCGTARLQSRFRFLYGLCMAELRSAAPLFCYMSGSGKIRHFHGTITGPSPEKDPI